jgi:hypothetical protein
MVSIPVISIQAGYANSGIGNRFPPANPGQGQSEFGNPINPLPPMLRSVNPECTKEVDAHVEKLKKLVFLGRVHPFWGGVAADNLDRFMKGKGGVKYIDSEWIRSFNKVKAIENHIKTEIDSRVLQIAPTLADGESKTVRYSTSPQISYRGASSVNELFWASGSSEIKVSTQIDLTRDGDIVYARADVFLDWSDPYDWHAMKKVRIPFFGDIFDRENEMLQFCKGAKPFLLASSWKLNYDTSVRVADEPVGGAQKPSGDREKCGGITGQDVPFRNCD